MEDLRPYYKGWSFGITFGRKSCMFRSGREPLVLVEKDEVDGRCGFEAGQFAWWGWAWRGRRGRTPLRFKSTKNI